MSLPEPGWVNGDDVARGIVDECPRCGELSLRHGMCEECGYDDLAPGYDPYDAYKDDLAAEFFDNLD